MAPKAGTPANHTSASAIFKRATASKTPAKKAAAEKTSAKNLASKATGNYTKPELREHIKQEVTAGDKGGRPGQWSARKAQLVAHEYVAEGGGYKHPRDEAQQHLKDWGDEHWHTEDGKPAIHGETTSRYLPDEAWQQLSPAEKRATERKKEEGSSEGKQFVANTEPAKKARKRAQKA